MQYHPLFLLMCLLIPFIVASCKETQNVRQYKYITLAKNQNRNAYTLSKEEQAEFSRIIVSLSAIDKWVRNAPEMVLLGYKEQDSEPDQFSVYLDEGFIYWGFYLDAFSERMHDKKSHCLLLSQDAKAFLEQILQTQADQASQSFETPLN